MSPPARAGRLELRILRFLVAIQAASALDCLVYAFAVPTLADVPRSYAAITLAPWLLAVASIVAVPSRSRRVLRGVSAACAAAYLLSTLMLVAGTAVGVWPPSGVPWLMVQSTVAASAAATAAGAPAGVGIAVIAFVATTLLRAAHDDGGLYHLIDDSHLVFLGVLVSVFADVLAAARVYDRGVARTTEAIAATAAESARRDAHERMEALVHDEVFTALLLGTRGAAVPASAQAGRALDLLRQVDASSDDDRMVSGADLLRRVRDVAAASVPAARITVRAHGELRLPAHTADALVGAVRQALGNAARHAPDAAVSLRLETSPQQVRVVVVDDGPGFDQDAVPSHRMGISVSILGRVNALPGGSAVVDATPGAGTVVTVSWRPPAPRTLVQGVRLDRLRRRARFAVGFFAVGQSVLAALALLAGSTPWVVVAAYGGILVGTVAVGWRHLGRPAWANTLVVVAVCWLVGALGWVPGAHAGEAADWYLAAVGLIASFLAIRGRVVSSVVAVAVPVGVAAAGLTRQHAALLPYDVVFTTPVLFVLYSLLCSPFLRSIRTRTEQLAAVELADLDRYAAESARLLTLQQQARAITELVAPTLEALRGATTVPAELVAECRALEGQLRDGFRGGRLAAPPVVAAARDARLRGIDVVLLDDAPERHVPEDALVGLHRWMADSLRATEAGRFTGRILPDGRDALASAVTDADSALYPR